MVEKKGKVEERKEGLSEEEFHERRQRIIQLEGKGAGSEQCELF